MQHVIDEIGKSAALSQHDAEVLLSLLGGEVAGIKQLGEAEKAGERCAQLMAHERNHLVLRAADGQDAAQLGGLEIRRHRLVLRDVARH